MWGVVGERKLRFFFNSFADNEESVGNNTFWQREFTSKSKILIKMYSIIPVT